MLREPPPLVTPPVVRVELAREVSGEEAALLAGRIGGRIRYTTSNPFTPVAGAYQDVDGDWVPVDGPLLAARLQSVAADNQRLRGLQKGKA